MAYNVHGNPITNTTLDGMPKYADKTTNRMTVDMKNAQELNGQYAATYGKVYNDIRDTKKFVFSDDWQGKIGNPSYPELIENNQKGMYMHNGTQTKSSAAVVYCGKNADEVMCDWMLVWSNPLEELASSDKVYTEIREANHIWDWDEVYYKLEQSCNSHCCTWNGCVSEVELANNKFKAKLRLVDLMQSSI